MTDVAGRRRRRFGSRSRSTPSSPIARPTRATTARLLDVLAEDGIPAGVFVQGRWASGEPALARRIAEDGHVVGNHSHHHARMTLLTGAGIMRDILEAEQAIGDATGVSPKPWFRCPFGAGARSPRVIRRLAEAGYRDVSWHVDSSGLVRDQVRRLRVGSCAARLRTATERSCSSTAGPLRRPRRCASSVRRLREAGRDVRARGRAGRDPRIGCRRATPRDGASCSRSTAATRRRTSR